MLTLLLNDGSEYGVTQKDIDEWQDTFPNVDVLQQLKAMKLWLKDNPKKRKTRNGIRRLLPTGLTESRTVAELVRLLRNSQPMLPHVRLTQA